MHELGAEARRKVTIRDAIASGKFARRHVEGAENDIEHRKSSGEILFAAGCRRRVMPAMKDRRGDHVFKGAKGPIEIGVHEGRVREGKRRKQNQNVRRNTGKNHDDAGQHALKQQIDGMKACRRNPFQLVGRMMHGVVLPQSRTVKAAVGPVQDDVLADKADDHLDGDGQAGKRSVTVRIEGDETITRRDAEYDCRSGNKKSETQKRATTGMKNQ